jgi:glycosyltransferase involved in cell wall biosynthesis
MKTIKVYALPSHQTKERNSGVDYARVNSPMKYLDGYVLGDFKFKVDVFDINKKEKESWLRVAKKYDLVFLNYTVVDWHYAAMASVVHGEGKKIVMDIDDAIWHVQEDNIVHNQLKELNAGYIVSCILDDVDGVTTTNGYLRNIIVDRTNRRHEHVKVMENQVDLNLYNKTFPAKDSGTITLMHFGSTSHFDDLMNEEFLKGMDRIMKEYPNVVFKAIGSFISQLRMKWGKRYSNAFGDVDIYRWIQNKFPEYMNECDIMVVPLNDTLYNRSKSDIKFLESGSAMKPGVFSDTRPYRDTIEHGKTGYLARTADDWYESLKILIDSKEKRQEIGQNAYDHIKKERQIQNNVKEYADFFLKILGHS